MLAVTLTFGLVLGGCDTGGGGSGSTDPALSGAITITDGANPVTSSYTGDQLTASYSGSESGITYQWNKGGTALPGETNTTCTPTEAGTYTVTVSAAGYQSKTSDPVTVTVDPAAAMNAEDFGAGVTLTTLIVSTKADFGVAKTAIEGTAGNYVLTITDTVDVEDVSITPAANTIVSLRGGGTLHYSTGTGTGTAFFSLFEAESKLVLRNATLKGHTGNDYSLVLVAESTAAFVMHGGTITGNTATNNGGGGVLVIQQSGGTFTKTGGTIYGKDGAANKNEAANDGDGHAVFVYVDGSNDLYRDTTAGTGVNLNSSTSDNWGQ